MDPRGLAEQLLADAKAVRCLSVAERVLEGHGFEVVRARHPADHLIAMRGEDGPVLSGHVDVVPAGEGWTREAFGGSWTEGRLYGRGASDMRGPVAAMLAAACSTEVPAGVLLTTDEETTMATARKLVADGVLDPVPLVVVGEPTGLQVATCGKGVAWMEVRVRAPSGHAATPIGEGGRRPAAAERLVELLAQVPREPLDVRHPTLGSCTAAITALSCQQGPFNVLPSQAGARIDCRFPAPATPDEMLDAVLRAWGHPSDVEVELVKREPAFESDQALGELVVRALQAGGVASATTGVPFASEAGHWSKRAPTVVCGPGSIDRAHAPDEYITQEELEQGTRAYRAILEQARPVEADRRA